MLSKKRPEEGRKLQETQSTPVAIVAEENVALNVFSEPIEKGETSETERLRYFYWKAVEIVAKSVVHVALEEFIPFLRPMSNYSLQDFK